MSSPLPNIQTRRVVRKSATSPSVPLDPTPEAQPVEPRSPKPEGAGSSPARRANHVFVCPFSGKPLEFRKVGQDMHWMVISPYGWSSKLFPTEEVAKEWASSLNGVQTYHRPRIEMREREAPVTDAQDAVDGLSPGEVRDDDLPESLRPR